MVMRETGSVSFWTQEKKATYYFPAESATYARRRTLQRRRQMQRVTALALIAMAVLLGFFAGRARAGGDRTPAPKPISWITVGEGDTLWGLATKYRLGSGGIDALAEANPAAARGALFPGQRLQLP